jgi:peptide methionine sulfoxide reductase MsrA
MILIFDNKNYLNVKRTMKKLLLPMMMVATMFACQSPETKTAEKADASVDKQTGTFTSLDEKSAKVKQLSEAYMNNDSTQIYAHYASTVKVYDQMANHQEGGKTVPNRRWKSRFCRKRKSKSRVFFRYQNNNG